MVLKLFIIKNTLLKLDQTHIPVSYYLWCVDIFLYDKLYNSKLSLSIYLFISISLYIYLYISLSLFIHISLFISPSTSLFIYICISLHIFLFIYPSLSLSLYLSISLYPLLPEYNHQTLHGYPIDIITVARLQACEQSGYVIDTQPIHI